MNKYYLQTEEQLKKLIEKGEIPSFMEDIIRNRLQFTIGSRFLIVEITKGGLLNSIGEVDASKVPLCFRPDEEIDSALYL